MYFVNLGCNINLPYLRISYKLILNILYNITNIPLTLFKVLFYFRKFIAFKIRIKIGIKIA
jgi:hypothetical protein